MAGLAFTFSPLVRRLCYNGVEWNNSTRVESFAAKPVEDASGRTFTHVEFEMTASMTLNVRSLGTRRVSDIISRLTQPAAGLILNGHGFGDLDINLGGLRDVKWGPKPRLVLVDNRGAGNAVKIRWTVQWATLTCGDAVTFGTTQPLEFCWKVNFDVDKYGMTKRTVSGFVTVPATRFNADDRRLPVSVDQLRERISPAPIPGFRRIPGTFDIDYAKTRCDFSIVDEEFPGNVPPPGVIDAQASHTFNQEPGKPFVWVGTLEATYEVARGYPASVAYDAFFALLRDRVGLLQTAPRGSPGADKHFVWPIAHSVSEPNLYGHPTVKLSTSYRASNVNLKLILGYGGLWRPAPGADGRLWLASMPRHLGAYGVSGLTVRISDDRITDLCKPEGGAAIIGGAGVGDALLRSIPNTFGPSAPPFITTLGAGVGAPRPPGAPVPTATILGRTVPTDAVLTATRELQSIFPDPEPGGSYLEYRCDYRIETEGGAVVATTLPTVPLERNHKVVNDISSGKLPRAQDSSLFPPADGFAGGGGRLDTTQTGETFVHQRTRPILYVFITGHSLRHSYPVAVPELEQVGGRAVTPCNREGMGEGFKQGIVGGDAIGRAIYIASWNLRYVVTDEPRRAMLVPPNPLIDNARV